MRLEKALGILLNYAAKYREEVLRPEYDRTGSQRKRARIERNFADIEDAREAGIELRELIRDRW